jgi:hypothetical protein
MASHLHRSEPAWLVQLRENALGSAEWVQVSQRIESRVRSELSSRGLGAWKDLSAEEKSILLNEVGEEVRSHASFDTFFRRLGRTVDNVLLREENAHWAQKEESRAVNQPPADSPEEPQPQSLDRHPKRHPDIVQLMEIAGDGASALLRQAPENLHVLRVIGCRGLPPQLRFEVWKLQLRNAVARKEYQARVAVDRLSVVSKNDPDIAKSCRTLLDAEFDDGGEDGGLADIQLPCKSILSYIHRQHGGLIGSPLRYIAIVLVWAFMSANSKINAQLDDATLVEYMFGLLEETHYRTFFDIHSFTVREERIVGLVNSVSGLVREADPSFLELIASLLPSSTDDAEVEEDKINFEARLSLWWEARGGLPPAHIRERVAARVATRNPWNFYDASCTAAVVAGVDSKVPSPGALLYELVLPLVQRLFSGMMDSLDAMCRMWDTLLLLGPSVLPHLCASYLIAARSHAQALLPDHREHAEVEDRAEATPAGPSVQDWEWALNSSCGSVSILEVQAVFEKHFLPRVRTQLQLRETRESLRAAALPQGEGRPTQLAHATAAELRAVQVAEGAAGGVDGDGQGARADGERGGRAVEEKEVQTDGWEQLRVREEGFEALHKAAEPALVAARLLSPRILVSAAAEELPAGGGGAEREAAQEQKKMSTQARASEAAHAMGRGVRKAGERRVVMEESMEMWYGGKVYSLVIPEEIMVSVSLMAAQRSGRPGRGRGVVDERMSSVADRILRYDKNQDLLAAVITLERKLPSPVHLFPCPCLAAVLRFAARTSAPAHARPRPCMPAPVRPCVRVLHVYTSVRMLACKRAGDLLSIVVLRVCACIRIGCASSGEPLAPGDGEQRGLAAHGSTERQAAPPAR